ncbi:MAG: methyltransferase domain-containing protein [Tessaracoccus sp.]|uniref:class I SAM-dependent methyltransferase n=1 Tax=Tessaracoccus sp. TaxID=1971211 RepID=UPI001EB53B68|nr:class I SAM-dependent methyltransferase [Tessaracoccus sp.]MBK7819912.1 methyltransferase domain-containing protein [Tessaracoccus sp.]
MTPSQERVRRYWDGHAARFDAMIAPMERRFLAASREWAAGRARGRVLEVAVGTGLNLPYYGPDARLTAVEFSDGMLRGARARAARLTAVDFALADGERLPFADARFDAVVCTYSLCGFRDPRRAVEEMLRVLRPGGDLLLVDHIGSSNPFLRVGQLLLEAATYPLQGERFTRRPRRIVEALGVPIVATQRLHHGIIERVHARR